MEAHRLGKKMIHLIKNRMVLPLDIVEIPVLKVRFAPRIQPWELNAFRGAVAAKVGLEYEWFHNHNNNKENSSNYHYRYPLVQYKLMKGQPGIFFLGQGVEEAMRLFVQPDWTLTFTRGQKRVHLENMKRESVHIGLSAQKQHYRLRSWMAFNQTNYESYQKADSLIERLQLMERALVGHILALANGLSYHFPERFSLAITDLGQASTVTFSGNKMLAFDIAFQTDAVLPLGAGLGRGVGRGFGEVESV